MREHCAGTARGAGTSARGRCGSWEGARGVSRSQHDAGRTRCGQVAGRAGQGTGSRCRESRAGVSPRPRGAGSAPPPRLGSAGQSRSGSGLSLCQCVSVSRHVCSSPSTVSLGTQLRSSTSPVPREDLCFSLVDLFIFCQRFAMFLVLLLNIWQ